MAGLGCPGHGPLAVHALRDSHWKALRWIAAADALEVLPRVSEAFASGRLSIDKVVELCRCATPQTEEGLLAWAQGVSCAAIRRRGDLAASASIEEVLDAERARFATWWWSDDGLRFGLSAELPAASGAVVARALQRLAERVPVMPGENDATCADARRADALVAVCSARLGSDPDPDRATVVVHGPLASLVADRGEASLEDGAVLHPETVRRLACSGRIQTVIEDEGGQPLALGRISREPSAAMARQLRYRDGECRFPGCGARQFTQAHHIVWWTRGGTTDLSNLVLVCAFHHRLVHEHGWGLRREPSGEVRWLRPDGASYHAGPDPPPRGGAGGMSVGRHGPVGYAERVGGGGLPAMMLMHDASAVRGELLGRLGRTDVTEEPARRLRISSTRIGASGALGLTVWDPRMRRPRRGTNDRQALRGHAATSNNAQTL